MVSLDKWSASKGHCKRQVLHTPDFAGRSHFLDLFAILIPASGRGLEFHTRALRESPKARAAINLLVQLGWLVALDPQTVVRGSMQRGVAHCQAGQWGLTRKRQGNGWAGALCPGLTPPLVSHKSRL
jgi:hypothetical protein